MSLLASTVVALPASVLPPLAVGFMGLGTGYLIYGPQELFGYPKRDRGVNEAMGVWGIWMPGFMQFVTGILLLLGLSVFGNYTEAAGVKTSAVYMAGLAFTAYGVHWFAIGWNRARGNEPRANVGMTIAFFLISILGMIVFFDASDPEVGGLFLGLTLIYAADFFVTIKADLPPDMGNLAERALGVLHLGTGLWLMYLMFAATINFAIKGTLPL
jgi:hypothetical protein